MRDVETQLGGYWAALIDEYPVPSAAALMESGGPLDEALDSGQADACERCGAELPVIDLRGTDERPAPTPRKRRAGVLAVAAAILFVVGVVVLADQNENNVETDPVVVATTPEPVPSPTSPHPTSPPEEAGPPPSVVDSLGYRWSQVPHDDAVFGGDGRQAMLDVTVGGPGLVAVGEVTTVWDGEDHWEGHAAVWTSVDGLTWSRVPHDEAVFGGDGYISMNTVIAGGPGLVAMGGIEDSKGEEAVIWTSVDGITWTRHEDAFSDRAGPHPGTVPGPGLVVGGENDEGSEVWTSADGATWSRVPHDQQVFGHEIGAGNGMTGLTQGGPGFVAVGSDGVNSDAPTGRGRAVVWTSVDGLTWSRVPHDEAVFGGVGDQGMFDVAVGGPGLVAVGENAQGAPIWTSVDGLTWTQVPNDDEVFGGPNKTAVSVFEVVAGELGLLAFGEDRQGDVVWTSVDGITWTRHEAILEGETRTIAGGPGLVAVGTDGDDAVVWVATPEN